MGSRGECSDVVVNRFLAAEGEFRHESRKDAWQLQGTSADGCWSDTATSAWKRSATRWKPSPRAPERQVTTQVTTQMSRLRAHAPSKLLGDLVDLVGIEPTTSSMPWKRAPSCATGPRENNTALYEGLKQINSRLLAIDSQTRWPLMASLCSGLFCEYSET